MDRTESLTTGYGSRTQFDREKERLIIEINQGMDTVNRNLLQLNQNLDSAISLGKSFGRIASLWSDFGMIINPPADYEETSPEDGEEMPNGVTEDTNDGTAADEAMTVQTPTDKGGEHIDKATSSMMDEDF
ncbi:hypothetical protein GGI15_001250 [Coemansia interrupta]|uniref:DASH complex subunit DAD1 n=1 Tax=Coemansia interrupta TaxID=1126814 RepID=A0A9W8HRM0_9FUNG|nr:hypothetical protein GGI15_001250 [Coemansia interrupta]